MKSFALFLLVALAMLSSAAALTCYKYETTHKSEAGKIDEGAFDPDKACSDNDGAGDSTPCVQTCEDGLTICYNYYQDRGFGGSGNYGRSKGGCFSEPVDDLWTSEGCTSNLDTASDNLRNCCTEDNCNTRPNAASTLSVMSAVFAILLMAILA
mmetsp:Transcript_21546/g.25941  ORF Transcript_21546/g.25941 Transcript_21546/m.25941 type:complete len:154 (-) Transcript_21546:68-529(-)|eukprot:CAMPEP_0197855138 /NCGR_PEP_ID=MMETSP1438-20131217/26063_1 /TAXON_ID=1461541 /ORGANISM="Pterosperma sp., Strain CCMP1384" /LENGTH=153 /DNA_ID=CAMNT_0043470139 /DNA_START=132 /DNA_END=593 /DNA_ORIENTATION=+